jgi:CheY-like chemotaxis protein
VAVQPKALLDDVKQMFASEAAADNVNIIVQINPSYAELEVDWVKLDPGRLLQVMINFCSNALKFTRGMPKKREIKMGLGASREAPSHSTHDVRYLKLPSELKKGVEDHTNDLAWGKEEVLYLRIEVIDSGKGMTSEEMERLFKRFTQTSPRTHTKYGGTGLGLFIARLLIGLQGGEVGASSTPEVGSIFAFYVKCRRSDDPNRKVSKSPSSTDIAVSRPLSPSTIAPQPCSKFSLLVVEDNLVNQKILSRHLGKIGFSVHVANHGREAVDFVLHLMAAQRLPELSVILMDVGKFNLQEWLGVGFLN